MTWVDQSSLFGFGAVLTSTQVQNMRDNLTAVANRDSGAPLVYGATKVLLKKITHTSSVEFLSFENLFTTSFDIYEIDYYGMRCGTLPTSDSSIAMGLQLSDDGGVGYFTNSENYQNTAGGASSPYVAIRIGTVADDFDGAAAGGVRLYMPSSSYGKKLFATNNVNGRDVVANSYAAYGGDFRGVSSLVEYDSIRIMCGSGGDTHYFDGGVAVLYGVVTNSF